ncbi:MAG: hypothetical protein HS117_03545 [Verrucomicrobiaceae bacterium]|nr:hypothetical protein [Verrucomicrobiaceae bacterium]
MKLQARLTLLALAITSSSGLSAAGIPSFKGAPVAVKAPSVPKVPVVPPAAKIPVVRVPVVKVPAAPKTPVIPQVPVVRITSAPKVPVMKVPAVSKVVSVPKTPSVAGQIRVPQPPKPVMAIAKAPVPASRKIAAVPAKPATSRSSIEMAKNLTTGQASGGKDFVARRVGPFHSVNKAYEKAAAPANPPSSAAPANTDPATAAGEMGWTPWWAAGSTSSSGGGYSSSAPPPQADPYAMSAKGPREPSKKKLLYAPNPVKK